MNDMPNDDNAAATPDRYLRQITYGPLGKAGQDRLRAGRALVYGCGALGNVVADTLVRAGVGKVRIVDPDIVETHNLQRQMLFDEDDAREQRYKVTAAADRLRRINSTVEIEPIVARLDESNVEQLCRDMDVVVDGVDNFQARYIMNDHIVQIGLPWVYGGCVGAEGQTMTIIPGKTACLRCLMPECPPVGSTPTCNTNGILRPIVGVIASIEAMEAIKILSGNVDSISRQLTVVERWDGRIRQVDVSSLRDQVDCPVCKYNR